MNIVFKYVIFIAIFLSIGLAHPLLERGFRVAFDNFRSRFAVANSIAWIGAAVAMCTVSPYASACWVTLAIAAFSSADGEIAFDGNTGSAIAD